MAEHQYSTCTNGVPVGAKLGPVLGFTAFWQHLAPAEEGGGWEAGQGKGGDRPDELCSSKSNTSMKGVLSLHSNFFPVLTQEPA